MSEFGDFLKTLKDVGLLQYLFFPISVVILLVLLKKFVFVGSGEVFFKIGGFLRGIIEDHVNNGKEHVKAQTGIEFHLDELCQKFDKVIDAFIDNRKHVDERLAHLETVLETHAAETHSLILLLKKKSDTIQDTLDMVDTKYFKSEAKTS